MGAGGEGTSAGAGTHSGPSGTKRDATQSDSGSAIGSGRGFAVGIDGADTFGSSDATRAAELFFDLVAHHADGDRGGAPRAFEELVRAHPELETHLRRLDENWNDISRVLAEARPGAGVGLGVGLHDAAAAPDGAAASAPRDLHELVLRRMARFGAASAGRYRVETTVGEGGMGLVLKVWDGDLRRPLAMKVLRSEQRLQRGPNTARYLARFLEEAQITSQLDHPGIVPVHELGLDADGRPYFTMKLVRGSTLRDVFAKLHGGDPAWPQARVLGVLLKVCEAMAYAHVKGVVHRDLKPANVMVGRFGEVYVMDWGLAHVLGTRDTKDLRPRPEAPDRSASLQTERGELASDRAGSDLYTMDGHVLGTPAYMPPEQASGRIAEIGPASDVYAVGAILYHLLSGRMPFVEPGSPAWPHAILGRLQEGPPRPLAEIAPEAPAELVSICEKATARASAARYPDMQALADDLRAYLEGRVVRAHQNGALTELRKWVGRNRAMAAAVGVALGVLVVAGVVLSWQERRRFESARLAAAHHYAAQAERGWPGAPASIPERERFLAEVAELRPLWTPATESHVQELLAALPDEPDPLRRHLEAVHEELGAEAHRFPDIDGAFALLDAPRYVHARTRSRLQKQSAAASEHEQALVLWDLFDPSGGRVAEAEAELAAMRAAGRRGLEESAGAWTTARAAIAASPRYSSLDLAPQWGLVPLREDPASGLWEFWHVLSGAQPEIGPDGRYELAFETGIVLVLMPGGTFEVGFSGDSPHSAWTAARPSHRVDLDPWFLSKYELTQGQCWRALGGIPGRHRAWIYAPRNAGGHSARGGDGYPYIDGTHPAETLDYAQCERIAARWGLTLPTEALWERAARTAAAREREHDNLYGFHDGWETHAPVDFGPPNELGLYQMRGNVREWCRDAWQSSWNGAVHAPGDGHRTDASSELRSVRGGSFLMHGDEPLLAPFARNYEPPATCAEDLGVRFARPVGYR